MSKMWWNLCNKFGIQNIAWHWWWTKSWTNKNEMHMYIWHMTLPYTHFIFTCSQDSFKSQVVLMHQTLKDLAASFVASRYVVADCCLTVDMPSATSRTSDAVCAGVDHGFCCTCLVDPKSDLQNLLQKRDLSKNISNWRDCWCHRFHGPAAAAAHHRGTGVGARCCDRCEGRRIRGAPWGVESASWNASVLCPAGDGEWWDFRKMLELETCVFFGKHSD